MTDADTVEHRLRNFAQGCRGSMWQSRDETISLMDAAADEITRLKAAIAALPPAVPDEADLDERMKAAGMIPLSEMLESHGPMEKWMRHADVHTFDDFCVWIKSKQKSFMTMRMQYELGDEDKDDEMWEWVFAHAAVFDGIAAQLRAITTPDPVAEAAKVLLGDDIALSKMAGAMHDGPLGADEYWFSAATEAGGWCLDCVRTALRALTKDGEAG